MKITRLIRAIIIAGVVCFCRPVWAQDVPQIDDLPDYGQFVSNHSVADTLEELQKQVESQGDAISDLKSALKKKVDSGHSSATMKVSGRIHADYWGIPEHDGIIETYEGGNPQDRIGFRRMRFGVSGKLPSNMLYKIEMEFAGGYDSEFRDVYLGWTDIPVFQTLLLGNQKRPYSLDHLNSSRYNVFLERPFIIESFNQDSRRFGLASYGVSECQDWNWRYGVYNSELMQNDGQAINDHVQLEFAGRLANTFWYDEASGGRGYGHWGVAASHATVDGGSSTTRFRHRAEARHDNRWLNTGTIADADNYDLLAFETAMNFGAAQFVAEYQNVWLERDTGDTVRYHGGYMQLSYFLTGEHMPWDRKSGTLGRIKPHENFFLVNTCDDCVGYGMGAWQVALRWSYADFSEVIAVPTATGTTGVMGESLTVGLNWYWTPSSRMQFNWLHGSIEDVNGDAGEYDIVGARFMVDF